MNKKILIITAIFFVFFSFVVCITINQDVTTTTLGIDISGLSHKKATEKALNLIKEEKEKIHIKINYENQIFEITSSDLSINNVDEVVNNAFTKAKSKNFFDKINIFKNRSKKIFVSTAELLSGFDKKIEEIKQEVEKEMENPRIEFFPQNKKMFVVDDGVIGVKVNKEELYKRIEDSLETKQEVNISLPVFLTMPTITKQEIEKSLVKRSEFSTNYSSSVGGRKYNVKLSLSAFNGMRIEPNETVSFNQTINKKIPFSRFQIAKIIVGGEFVDGRGGGMCQASSTLYNALLLADLEILKVSPHTLPVGYVKLAFDAMVNPGSVDLVFKNPLETPIFIKTYGDESDCFVEIYGESLPKGLEIKRKSVLVRSIKHDGDKVISDVNGIYGDKITFKGEFYRIKYPKEGVEAKAYLQYYIDGELVEERLIRRATYSSQQGIVYEGTEELPEGLILETSTSNYIPPQNQTTINEENIDQNIQSYNPSHYNP